MKEVGDKLYMKLLSFLNRFGIKPNEKFNGFSLEEIAKELDNNTIDRIVGSNLRGYIYREIFNHITTPTFGTLEGEPLSSRVNELLSNQNFITSLLKDNE